VATRTLLVAASALVLAGCAALGQDARRALPPPAAGPPPGPAVLLTLSGNVPPHTLRRVDPRTLQPGAAGVALHDNVASTALSPNGRRVALGSNWRARIEIVDLARMRLVRTIHLGVPGSVVRMAWPSRDRLLVVVEGPLRTGAVNPRTGAVGPFRRVRGTALAHDAAGSGIAFLLAPRRGIGPVRVAFSDGGPVRSAALEDIRGGTGSAEGAAGTEMPIRTLVPAFAIEPGGRRAVVVAANGRIAEVDLASLGVRYHEPGSTASLLGRMRNWLEPTADAKLLEGTVLTAVWLPSGLVVASGVDYRAEDAAPAGATVLDTRDWSTRKLNPAAMSAQRLGNGFALLRWSATRTTATVYDGAARRRFRVARDSLELVPAGREIYAVSRSGVRYERLAPRTGIVLARRAAEPSTWLFAAGG
jgi:hypothetical protein